MRTQDQNLAQGILAALNTQSGIRLAIFGLLLDGYERVDSDLDFSVDGGYRLLPRLFSNRLTSLAELRTT